MKKSDNALPIMSAGLAAAVAGMMGLGLLGVILLGAAVGLTWSFVLELRKRRGTPED
jgi:hypothetical protein